MERLFAVLVLGCLSVNAQTLTTETFGSGANQFSIDFVLIGNPGNSAHLYDKGSVPYVYNIGKYEISRDIFQKANLEGSLGISLNDMSLAGISGNGPNQPVTGNWFKAAQFVNWLNTTKGFTPAYKFDSNGILKWDSQEAGYQPLNPYRNANSRYWLPSWDEWYKAAFGKPEGGWSTYTTGSDDIPVAINEGTSPGSVVYNQDWAQGPAEITNAGGLSSYGTMAQGGNVWEWTDSPFYGIPEDGNVHITTLGGSWGLMQEFHIQSSYSGNFSGVFDDLASTYIGFRVAMVPEPSSLSLLLAGGAVLAAGRRRKQD